jgi:hypothetical protein
MISLKSFAMSLKRSLMILSMPDLRTDFINGIFKTHFHARKPFARLRCGGRMANPLLPITG